MSITSYESIYQQIKQASESNQLIVFIGAGMSNNFGFLTWNSLVRKMYRELTGKDAAKGKAFTSDELLRIPQALKYQSPNSYEKILKEAFGTDRVKESDNPILDEVMKLKPKHIITTNYDVLIERYIADRYSDVNQTYSLQEGYRRRAEGNIPYPYVTVVRDGDMAYVDSNHLLLKIHGDVQNMNSLVLCEDDYLEYSDSHILMENFIKSLLINHTFLFIGYGVGDSNLKLIMKWVEKSVSRQNSKQEISPRHILVSAETKAMDKYQREYLEQKQIQILQVSDLPASERKQKQTLLANPRGNCLLQVLKSITLIKQPKIGREQLEDMFTYFEKRKAVHVREICAYLKKDKYEILKEDSILHIRENTIGEQLVKALFHAARSRKVDDFVLRARQFLSKVRVQSYIYDWKTPARSYDISLKLLPGISCLEEFCLTSQYEKLWKLVRKNPEFSGTEKSYWAMYTDHEAIVEQLSKKQWSAKKKTDLYEQVCFARNMEQHYRLQQYTQICFGQMWHRMPEQERQMLPLFEEYMNRCAGLSIQFIETSEKMRSYCYSGTVVYDPTEFLITRSSMTDFVRTLVLNGFYITGLYSSTIIHAAISEIFKNYIDLLVFFLSPFCRNKPSWFAFSAWDIYIMINFFEAKDLDIFWKKYEINQLKFDQQINRQIIDNCVNLLDFNTYRIGRCRAEGHMAVHRLKNVMNLLEKMTLDRESVELVMEHLFQYLDKLMSLDKDQRSFLPAAGIFEEFLMEQFDAGYQDIISPYAEKLFMKFLRNFLKEDHENRYSQILQTNVEWFADLTLLCEVIDIKHHRISKQLIIRSWECYKKWYGGTPSYFLVNIYPFAGKQIQDEISQCAAGKVLGMDIYKLRIFLLEEIIGYSKDVEALLLKKCEAYAKLSEKQRMNMRFQDIPLRNILRLWQNGKILDIQVFYQYKDLDPWFSFVCFPEEFDYTQFNVRGWCTWLEKEEYRQAAFHKNRQVLQKLFEDAISEGADEDVHRIYYKYIE